MEGTQIRQRMTLSDQLSLFQQPSNLRDLLKVREDDVIPRVTLAAVLASDKSSAAVSSGRTLLDVIREDEEARNSTAAAATWTAGSGSSASPMAEEGPATIRVSLMTLMEIGEREEAATEEETSGEARATADVAVMEEEEEEEDVTEVAKKHVCCVCMVRKKGAAFIPCGHTFCRVCSRELLGRRGNCPLCNGTIAEVLDIF